MMSPADFYILLKLDDTFKEFSVQVPKKYHYETTYFNYVDFPANKVVEYNVLFDYVKTNANLLKDKWGLSDEEYNELKDGLKLALIREHGTCSIPRRVFLETTVLFKIWFDRILRRLVG